VAVRREAPLRPTRVGLDATATADGRPHKSSCHVRAPDAERCFLCHSPTLRPWIVPRQLRCRRWTSYVEGLWSPSLAQALLNSQAKADAYRLTHFYARTPRVFLSQAGPQFGLVLLQAEHHLGIRRRLIAFRTKKATPLGRPRLACYAARDLARMPHSEGNDVTGPALCIGEKHWGVDIDQHHVDGCWRIGA
jgi:hypothetical protein